MNVSVNIECSPEEARRFFGLPDLTSLHEAYLGQLRTAVEKGVTPDMVRTMMETWGPMGEAGFSLWKQFLGQAAAATTRP